MAVEGAVASFLDKELLLETPALVVPEFFLESNVLLWMMDSGLTLGRVFPMDVEDVVRERPESAVASEDLILAREAAVGAVILVIFLLLPVGTSAETEALGLSLEGIVEVIALFNTLGLTASLVACCLSCC